MARGIMRLGQDAAGGIAAICHQSTVFANGTLVFRIGDQVQSHPRCWPHDAMPPMVTGSGTVITEGSPTCRTGDIALCCHQCTPGSSDVFVGGPDVGGPCVAEICPDYYYSASAGAGPVGQSLLEQMGGELPPIGGDFL